MRGISQQLSPVNFVEALLDIRWIKLCRHHKIPETSVALPNFAVDIRQESSYQIASGRVGLLSGSRVYVFHADRCLIAKEHFFQNGWGRDVDYLKVKNDVLGEYETAANGAPPKKKRGKAPEVDGKLVELAGNGMALADLSQIAIPLILCMTGIWSKDLQPEDLESLDLFKSLSVPSRASDIVIDHTDLNADLSHLQGASSDGEADIGEDNHDGEE